MGLTNWRTNGDGDNPRILIRNGDRVVGSMMLSNKDGVDDWSVEILWMAGDITGHFTEYGEALAFAEGVEKTFAAMEEK